MLPTVRHAESKLRACCQGILKGKELQVRALINALLSAGTRWQRYREALIHSPAAVTRHLRGGTLGTNNCYQLIRSVPGIFIQYSLWCTERQCWPAAPPQPRPLAHPRVTRPVLPRVLLSPSAPTSRTRLRGSPAPAAAGTWAAPPPLRAHSAGKGNPEHCPAASWEQPSFSSAPESQAGAGSSVQGAAVRSRRSRGWERCAPTLRDSSAALPPAGGLPYRGGWHQQSNPYPPPPRSRTAAVIQPLSRRLLLHNLLGGRGKEKERALPVS